MKNGQVLAITGGQIFTPFETIDNGLVIIKKGKIDFVGQADEVSIPGNARIIDATRKMVVPGFIDIHLHGGRDMDILDATYDAINGISKYVAEGGVTSFLPGTNAAPQENLVESAKAIKYTIEKGTDGAEVLGLHLEGPYLNLEKKGAHNPKYIRLPSIEELKWVIKKSGDHVKEVTIAPEIEGAIDLIKNFKNHDIIFSAGHSIATYEQMVAGIKAGISHAVHMFNGMKQFHHRDPGLIGAVLTRDEIDTEVIADGLHVHPVAIKVLIKNKSVNKVALITDSTKPSGMPDGIYEMSGLKIIIKDGKLRLKTGEIAGSSIKLNDAVRNMITLVSVPLREAIMMATITPAKILKLDHKKGTLEIGKDADITIIDSDINVHTTIVNGKIVYIRHGLTSMETLSKL